MTFFNKIITLDYLILAGADAGNLAKSDAYIKPSSLQNHNFEKRALKCANNIFMISINSHVTITNLAKILLVRNICRYMI